VETFLAVVAALINLLAIALYHDQQSEVLNGTAAALCLVVAVLAHLKRRSTSK
jgi:phosphate starvation-inducible membrane PsiE